MNRRRFLALVGAGTAGIAAAPLLSLLPAPRKAKAKLPDISVRFVRDYNIQADRQIQRFDVLYGVGYLRPDFACRVLA